MIVTKENLNKRKTSFLEKASTKYNNFYTYPYLDEEFETVNSIITVYCPIHGEFKQRARKHLEGRLPCSECVKDKVKQKTAYKTFEWFLKNARRVHGDKYEYDGDSYSQCQDDKIRIYCKEHGWFEQIIRVHLKGHGCPACSNCKPHNTESFILKAKNLHGDKYDYSKTVYGKNNRQPVCIICPKHGEFWQTPHEHLSGGGCTKCLMKTQTEIYNFIRKTFPEEIWDWEATPIWLGKQRFDIYCDRIKLAIEYNGEQHYFPIDMFGGEEEFENRVKLDSLKAQLCKDNNCLLYIIKYDDVNYDRIREDINNILNSNKNETY